MLAFLVTAACSQRAAHLDRVVGAAAPTTTTGTGAPQTQAAAAESNGTSGSGVAAPQRRAGSANTAARAAATSAPTQPGPVTFHVFDANGARLSWASFRTMQSNSKGASGVNDMLLDPGSLTVLQSFPLHKTSTGDPGFDLPARPVTLSLAWPTADGYSTLLLDVTQPGTYNFNLLAAEQAVASLDAAVAARPAYRPSPDFAAASQQAHAQLDSAHAAPDEGAQGAHAAAALDHAVHASVTLLTEYGQQYGAANRALRPQWGVTFDDISGGQGDLSTVRDLVGGDPQDGWVRIVFDRQETAASYVDEVNTAHGLGLHVLGQLLDSSDMAKVDLGQWQSRVASYVATLPSVDEWEIGNEVNGNWLGADVAAKVAYAASYVKAHTGARTLLTLYWQLGEDDAAHSMFTWLHANVSPDTMAHIDDVGLSLYPEDHPMGAAFDRVVATLHAAAPGRRVLVTELDYWSPDLDHTWTWGPANDPAGAGRLQLARFYQSAIMGYPYSGGGAYWWYYLAEALPKNQLWSTLASVHAAVAG